MVWADIDGDGQPELITGKRCAATATAIPAARSPSASTTTSGTRPRGKFTRHTIGAPGEGVGTGMQIRVADLNGDGRPDIVVAGKTGTWLLMNQGLGK